jgi:hypothetical protein
LKKSAQGAGVIGIPFMDLAKELFGLRITPVFKQKPGLLQPVGGVFRLDLQERADEPAHRTSIAPFFRDANQPADGGNPVRGNSPRSEVEFLRNRREKEIQPV